MEYLLGFCIIFIIFLVFLLLFSYLIPKKRDRLSHNKGVQYIIRKYKLTNDNKTISKIAFILTFVNSFVIALPASIFILIDMDIRWVGLISLAFFIVALLGLYNLVGIILKKKGW